MPQFPSIGLGYTLLACIGLAGCAQQAVQATIDPKKDASMTQDQPPEGGEATADAVAALADRIAEQSVPRSTRSPPPEAPPPEAPPAPPGPTLAPDDWQARVLRVIEGLETPLDTQPAQVAEALGLTLVDRNGSHEAHGELSGGGTYHVWVDALYGEFPDSWTVSLSQRSTNDTAQCIFSLDTLREYVTARGYSATEGVRRRDQGESALYRSVPTEEEIVFVVSADVIRPDRAAACVRELRIGANTPEQEA